ncbi:MAG: hypothetical protein ABIS26_00055 [Candidatus Paceibacterota bacterium]
MKNVTIIVVIAIAAILLFWVIGKNRVEVPVLNETTTTTTTTETTTNPPTNTNNEQPLNPTTTEAGTKLSAKLGQSISFAGVIGTVLSVVEDSRCPTDVQCIQAGTVKVKIRLTYGTQSEDATLGLNQTFAMAGHSITLLGVTPNKVSTRTIAPADYTFTFLVK